MKTREEALKYGLSFPDTYQEAPFHDPNWQLVRYKYNKKAFLWTYEREGFINLNVKVDPETAFFWRKAYSSVIPGYHQNKEHWNTIILDGSIPDKDIKLMIQSILVCHIEDQIEELQRSDRVQAHCRTDHGPDQRKGNIPE